MANWTIELFGSTNQGQIRERNEDNYFISLYGTPLNEDKPSFQQANRGEEHRKLALEQPVFAAVADGMGGHAGGDVASRLVVETLFQEQQRLLSKDALAAAQDMIVKAHQAIIDAGEKDYTLSDMGSTVVSLLFIDDAAIPIHVGDSRAYLYRSATKPVLQQLTKDHSEMRVLIELGFITPEDAKHHPNRSVILRNLGMRPRHGIFEVEVSEKVNFCAGDIFLLCSDGLTDMLDEQEMGEIVKEWQDDLAVCGRALIQAANDKGGYDNITVILAAIHRLETDGCQPETENQLQASLDTTDDGATEQSTITVAVDNAAQVMRDSEHTNDSSEIDSGKKTITKQEKPKPQAPFNQRKEAREHETLS